MNFINAWGLLFALFIPGIIVLYLLKQQHEDLTISSTYLWEKALEDIQASMPWQRLRRNLLMFLQIAAVLLFALAISRPFFNPAGVDHDYIIVLDCSASMQAEDVMPNRFFRVKEDVEKLIDGMLPGQRMTIIEAAQQSGILVNQTTDKGILKEGLGTASAGNGTSDMEEAISLANALAKEMADASIYLYTDQDLVITGDHINTFVYNEAGENRGIANVSYTIGSDEPVVMSSIVNYGKDCSLTLECKVDGVTTDVKEVEIQSYETANVYWNNIPVNGQVVEISILEEDDLMVDNRGWAVIETPSSTKVLLVTERNAFLEKAVKLRADVKLDKTTFEQAENMEGYQLYIFDGYLPKTLPEDGSIIIFNPCEPQGEGEFLKIGEEFEPGSMRLNGNSPYRELMQYIHLEQFHIAKAVSVEQPPWAQTILHDGENPLFLAGELENQRIAIFTFDIHNSDLPLKTDFPILIQNLMEWMLPRVVDQDIQKFSGEELVIYPLPHAEQLYITTPSGENIQLAPPFPIPPFNNTEEVGVYKVEQVLKEERVEGFFTIQVPVHKESDLGQPEEVFEAEGQAVDKKAVPMGRREIWNILIWMVLALILTEWWVYQRGY